MCKKIHLLIISMNNYERKIQKKKRREEISEYLNNQHIVQVGYICGPKSYKYIKFSIETLIKSVSSTERIEILIGNNCNDCDFSVFNEFKHKFYSFKVYDVHSNLKHPSRNHGEALNTLFWKYFNRKYGMVVDSDVAFLKKNWDIEYIKLMNLSDKIVIAGCGNSLYAKYKFNNFPSVYCPFFKTEKLKECGLTWEPWIYDVKNKKYIDLGYRDKKLDIILNELKDISITEEFLKKKGKIAGEVTVKVRCNNEYSRILSMKKGEVCKADTAFFLPIILKKNNYDGIFFETVKPKKNNSNLLYKYSIFNDKELENCWKNRKKLLKESQRDKFLNLFEVKYRDELYFTHLGQASKREFNIDPLCNLWIKSVKNYINR